MPPTTPSPDPIPLLARYLFGEGAAAAWRAAPPGGLLREWGRWFEAWVEGRERAVSRQNYQISINAWRKFLGHARKLPWEVEERDLEDWREALFESGLSPFVVRRNLLEIKRFYDSLPEGAPNPMMGVELPQPELYQNAMWLCKEEIEALLGAIDRESALGKQDFAFFLTLLLSGQTVRNLRNLRWGDLIFAEEGEQEIAPGLAPERSAQDAPLVRWRSRGGERVDRLPGETWEALRDHLEANGRLVGMQENDYIFAKMNTHWSMLTGLAKDWDATKPIPKITLDKTLRRYVAWAELAVEKVTFHDLHHSAVMLRANAGASAEEIQAWLGVRSKGNIRAYLEQMKKRPISEERLRAAERVWVKGPCGRKRGPTDQLINIKHGYYSKNLVAGQDRRGGKKIDLDAIIAKLESTVALSFELVSQEEDPHEMLKLMDTQGRAADRLVRTIDKARRLKEEQVRGLISDELEKIAEEFERGRVLNFEEAQEAYGSSDGDESEEGDGEGGRMSPSP